MKRRAAMPLDDLRASFGSADCLASVLCRVMRDSYAPVDVRQCGPDSAILNR